MAFTQLAILSWIVRMMTGAPTPTTIAANDINEADETPISWPNDTAMPDATRADTTADAIRKPVLIGASVATQILTAIAPTAPQKNGATNGRTSRTAERSKPDRKSGAASFKAISPTVTAAATTGALAESIIV